MKKALYVATVDIHIRTFHLPYLKLLHDNGYEVHVATNGDEQFPYCDVKHQICIERSPFKISNLKAIKQLSKIINNEQFEIVHCHTPMGAVVTRLAAKRARKIHGTRVIYTAHGYHFYKGAPLLNWLLFYPIEKWLSKYTDTIININKEDYALSNNKFRHRCKDIEYVPGVGIDIDKFDFSFETKEKRDFRSSFGLSDKDFVMIFPARLDKNKNQVFLLNCMVKLIRENDAIHLFLPGNDELNGFYQRIAKEKGIDKNIHFLGHRKDIPKLMRISNLAVSSSLREGLPVNVIEAFACGIPVVALNCRGMKDLVIDNENGFIIYDNSIDNFVEKIDLLIKDKVLYNNICNNNKLKSKQYDIDKIILLMKKIYNIK